MKKKFFNLNQDNFEEKITKIEDYLDGEPGGIMTQHLDGFKHTIQFVRELNGLNNLDEFFNSNDGNNLLFVFNK